MDYKITEELLLQVFNILNRLPYGDVANVVEGLKVSVKQQNQEKEFKNTPHEKTEKLK